MATLTPHPHKDLIIAWANGEDIQWFNKADKFWIHTRKPSWSPDTEYRVRPLPAYPRSSLYAQKCIDIVNNSINPAQGYLNIANEAVKQYMIENKIEPTLME